MIMKQKTSKNLQFIFDTRMKICDPVPIDILESHD